ncbi:MAG: DUF3592 domain-containing protein [Chloroflexi bacterium CFX4]|nr:DUF3592 domain-containing protein [Chloroflexi bacterium CFX4]MDL1921647.1 DUF3592 domain-containing protein [Chloroflexi bacterium CFX3]
MFPTARNGIRTSCGAWQSVPRTFGLSSRTLFGTENMKMSPVILIIAVVVLVVIGVVAYNALRGENEALMRRLASEGISVSGEVVQREIRRSTSGAFTTQFWLTYRYTVSGTALDFSESVSQEIYNRYPEGSRVSLTYLMDDPRVVARTETLIIYKQ